MATLIPHLTLAQVHAALAYYHANREEIEADIAAEEAEATRLEQEHFAAMKRAASYLLPESVPTSTCHSAGLSNSAARQSIYTTS